MDAGTRTTLAEAQRRLLLVLRARRGPAATAYWDELCQEAAVTSTTGLLTLDELDRVTALLVERGGVDAVAARSCRVQLVPLAASRAPRPPRPPRPCRDDADVVLDDEAVRAALHEPAALDEETWKRRLAELEADHEAA